MARKIRSGAPIYGVDEWQILETSFQAEHYERGAAVFALGNGYIGVRGTFEEGLSSIGTAGVEGTFINGFYETEPIKYPETAYGFAENSQTMLNVTNGKTIGVWLEEEPFDLTTGTILSYTRALNMRDGCLERRVIWRSSKGREAEIVFTRFVSFERPNLVALRCQVTPRNFSGSVRLVSLLDGNVTNLTADKDPRRGSNLQGRVLLTEDRAAEGTYGMIEARVQRSGMVLACAMEHRLTTDAEFTSQARHTADTAEVSFSLSLEAGASITLEKFVAYVSGNAPATLGVLDDEAAQLVRDACAVGFEALLAEQKTYLANYWRHADVEIEGDPFLQQGLRFNTFHLLQSAGRDGKTNIASKGVTGEGYEGHYFWDTETYVIPFFLFHSPHIAARLLESRYHMLEAARVRALQLARPGIAGPRGVLFPWRTISGEEASAYFPAGTAQYHINADIAFAIRRYLDVSNDADFRRRYGAEILFETARFWLTLGTYGPSKGSPKNSGDQCFYIYGVTGPDEYTALVDNNAYTNFMAQENLWTAARVARQMQLEEPEAYGQIATKIGLKPEEIVAWQAAGDAMYIPFEPDSLLYPQDDDFLEKPLWDFAHTPPEHYPLLLHYHYLVLYRHQVCKQADLILAVALLNERFTDDEVRANYDYYEPITTHDSSLSTAIYSIVASRIAHTNRLAGNTAVAAEYYGKAYQYFIQTARLDLDDLHENTRDGVHIANMAGTWLCVVYGIAGLELRSEGLCLRPYLPSGWERYRFCITYLGSLLEVLVNAEGTLYRLLEHPEGAPPFAFQHDGRPVSLRAGESIQM